MIPSNRNLLFILISSVLLFAFFSQCNFPDTSKADPRGPLYAGAASCANCHKNIYNDYFHTAHFTTSQAATAKTIGGSFKPGSNTFSFGNGITVVMEKRDSGLYQAAYQNGKMINAQRFDITFGGVKAETYLYWKGNQLYQLPMSYFKGVHSWTNSPGYDSTFADFTRPITIGCLDCHSSFAKETAQHTQGAQTISDFDKSSVILGVDCERCHGPAADHVYYQATHPEDKQAKHIITYASLTRVQKINMCAVCHSGSSGTMLRPTFGFKPNDNLSDYKLEDLFQTTDPKQLDVHGNQSRLLISSKCYISSQMDCATCHNVHNYDRQQIAIYSQKCMSCHTAANHNYCKMAPVISGMIRNNCIDCHMPAKPSSIITAGTSGHGKTAPYLVRNHHIAVYQTESHAVLNELMRSNRPASN